MYRQRAGEHIDKVKLEKSHHLEKGGSVALGGKPTLFRLLVHENALHEDDMSTERLKKEAMVLLGTGATTTRAVTIGIFELLSHPEKRMTLERELAVPMANWPREKPSLRSLEKLPYLQAVIQESLRYSIKPEFWFHAKTTPSIAYRGFAVQGMDNSTRSTLITLLMHVDEASI
ncbi:hypothetical protein ACRE_051870 [Hapsidospora chrysogenum ATCC 11550]|uniref:Cytochrome P450 n=1 Tax=Hapsidospora chrysogenum (strain ATCC 11550 / CBS 779.69 / DSM 880 / IAM 14645 / JCM 23072 / IMI 49137) TaxID=857340 RepID=A0A086T3U8_HAPC1|nr:hypothetical protein ACRE_051870 [Hapsidospora chrysogenum ATCC 11550]